MNTITTIHARDIYWIIITFLLASIMFYGYYAYFSPGGMDYIYRNWDGPGYLVVAKTLYNVDLINKINPFPFLLATHYAFQLPLYPLFIRIFSFIGYNESMIFVSQLFALLFSIALYFLIKEINPKANALVVSLLSIFYTPRWFIVSHVGSTEPQFLLFMTLFMIFAFRKKYLLSALFVSLAQFSKPQGIVFFVGVAVYFFFQTIRSLIQKKSPKNSIRAFIPYLLIPLSLGIICTIDYFAFGDFFLLSRDDILHSVKWSIFQILIAKETLNIPIDFFTVWKEAIVYNYILYFIPILLLFDKKQYLFGVVALVYFFSVATIRNIDTARYIIPIMPFLFLGYSEALSKKPVYLGLFICIPLVYLYSIAYINYNLAPL